MAGFLDTMKKGLGATFSGKRAETEAAPPPKPSADEEANKAAKARSDEARKEAGVPAYGKAKGGSVRMASGGRVRGGGCEQRGKTKGRFV